MTTVHPPRRHELTDGWTLHLVEPAADAPADVPHGPVPARVPGTVHTDLVRAGLLADPIVGTREEEQHWVGRSTWAYRTDIAWQPDGSARSELVLDGLDTVAEVRLNGELLATTRNMHRSYRLDVTDRLRAGDNGLEILFRPVLEEVDRVRGEVGELPATEAIHYPYVRKMACNFGWDWGPVLITAGIWRGVALESWTTARLAEVRPLATLDATDGVLEVHASVDRAGAPAGALGLRVHVTEPGASTAVVEGDGVIGDDGTANVRCRVPQVRPWWPVGVGDQPLYEVRVELVDGTGVVLDAVTRRTGFRTVEVVERADAEGTTWETWVNGRRIPVRGFNWIPDQPFVPDVDAARYQRRIDQAVAANANLLRVWGGGIYESPAFYEHCDATGVLVWQDFLFACAAYPETEDYAAEVVAEARQAVAERVHHPSLVLWNANNECTWGYHEWGWQEVLDGRPWGATYYAELLPQLLAELDPTRPYLHGSPSSGGIDVPPNDPSRGVMHIWDVWNERDYVDYRTYRPSFVAEFGFCGPATWATMREGVPDGELTLANPAVRHHLRAADGVTKLDRGLAQHFAAPADPDDWLWLTQLNQARALTLGVDHLRSLERCSGAVVWQLNDMWPVISWAAVDSQERLKPLWYALREAFSPRRVTVQPTAAGLELVAVNDEQEPWTATVLVRRLTLEGTELAREELSLAAPATGVARVPLGPQLADPVDPRREVLLVDTPAQRTSWYWERDKHLDYPPARWESEVETTAEGLLLRVRATSFVRDLAVFPDRLLVEGRPLEAHATPSELLLTLLPGECCEIHVPGAGPEHATALGARPVLRAVNDRSVAAR